MVTFVGSGRATCTQSYYHQGIVNRVANLCISLEMVDRHSTTDFKVGRICSTGWDPKVIESRDPLDSAEPIAAHSFLLFLALSLLFWNYRAPQVPSWIATSMSIVCGGVISLLAMGEPIRKNKYILGVALLFMLLPAALGCWAALQPERLPDQMLSFVTVLEGPGPKAKVKVDPNWAGEGE